jgi:hypothetical protein|tara:strand:+ start:438 stop:623 length:186 start_codon:yes stop_codon:yes gene_type:complete
MYNIGESVVHKDTWKQATVTEVEDQKMKIVYEDGSVDWVEESNVVKLLLDDGPSGNLLTEA